MLDLTTKKAKAFFLDRQRIMQRVDKARRRNLAKAGGLVRTAARRSMRPARRMRIAELDSEARQRHHIQVALAEREGRPKPKLPFVPSQAGEPPRTREGTIKRNLIFAYDPSSQSVVAGPVKFPPASGAPSILEYSGPNVAARPFMRPAEQRVRSKYVGLWKDSIV